MCHLCKPLLSCCFSDLLHSGVHSFRYAYTERILDMMRNIQKQRDETERVIEDIKRSQKDINALEGKLDRTYADLDATLFDVSKHIYDVHSCVLYDKVVGFKENLERSGARPCLPNGC